jgi:tripartite ATP-independent transporter DctP family solute receptor
MDTQRSGWWTRRRFVWSGAAGVGAWWAGGRERLTLLGASAEAAARMTLRFAHVFPVTNTFHLATEKFAKLVAEKTKGEVQIRIFPASQLGNERDYLEGLQLGTVDLAFSGPGVAANFDPLIGVFDLPFLYRDYDHANRVMDGPVGEKVWESYRTKAKIRILSSAAQGFRYVLTRDRVVNSLPDMKGLKVRTPEAPTFVQAFRLLGANPTPVPWGETYTAVQTKVVDGMEGVPEILFTAKMYEVGKLVARTRHILATLQLDASEGAWAKLPKEIQDVISEAGRTAWREQRQIAKEGNEAAERKLVELGVKFTDPDLQPFREAVRPMWVEWATKHKVADWIPAIEKA